MIRSLEKDTKAIEQEIAWMILYYKGAISLDQAWHLTQAQRKIHFDIVKEYFEMIAKSGLAKSLI